MKYNDGAEVNDDEAPSRVLISYFLIQKPFQIRRPCHLRALDGSAVMAKAIGSDFETQGGQLEVWELPEAKPYIYLEIAPSYFLMPDFKDDQFRGRFLVFSFPPLDDYVDDWTLMLSPTKLSTGMDYENDGDPAPENG